MMVRLDAHRPRPDTVGGTSSRLWRIGVSALPVAGFALALGLCYRATGDPRQADLRTPGVLAVDALLASAIALVCRGRGGAWRSASAWWWSLVFGLWSAAVFRLVPPFINEDALYFANIVSPDVPYVILGAVVHGAITMLLVSPLVRPTALGGGADAVDGDEARELGAASVLAFLIVAAVVRVATELRL